RTVEPRGVIRARTLGAVVLADLTDELSLRGELQELVAVIVAADPDVAILVDMQAVLVLHPLVPRTGPAPVTQQIALGIELHHRRRRLAAFVFGRVFLRAFLVVEQGRGTMQDPDVIVGADRDAGDLSQDPVLWKRLWPERLGLEGGRSFGLGALLSECGSQSAEPRQYDHHRENAPHRRLPFIFCSG